MFRNTPPRTPLQIAFTPSILQYNYQNPVGFQFNPIIQNRHISLGGSQQSTNNILLTESMSKKIQNFDLNYGFGNKLAFRREPSPLDYDINAYIDSQQFN